MGLSCRCRSVARVLGEHEDDPDGGGGQGHPGGGDAGAGQHGAYPCDALAVHRDRGHTARYARGVDEAVPDPDDPREVGCFAGLAPIGAVLGAVLGFLLAPTAYDFFWPNSTFDAGPYLFVFFGLILGAVLGPAVGAAVGYMRGGGRR